MARLTLFFISGMAVWNFRIDCWISKSADFILHFIDSAAREYISMIRQNFVFLVFLKLVCCMSVVLEIDIRCWLNSTVDSNLNYWLDDAVFRGAIMSLLYLSKAVISYNYYRFYRITYLGFMHKGVIVKKHNVISRHLLLTKRWIRLSSVGLVKDRIPMKVLIYRHEHL